MYLKEGKKFEDIVAIEEFEKSKYEKDPGTKCPPPHSYLLE